MRLFQEEMTEEWFIKLFTQENDLVLDPFLGSGTTSEVAQRMGRNSLVADIMPEYVETAKEKVRQKGSFYSAITKSLYEKI